MLRFMVGQCRTLLLLESDTMDFNTDAPVRCFARVTQAVRKKTVVIFPAGVQYVLSLVRRGGIHHTSVWGQLDKPHHAEGRGGAA